MADHTTLKELAASCKAAAHVVAQLNTQEKNDLLSAMADSMLADEDSILSENNKDVEN